MSPSIAKLPSQEDSALAFAEVYTAIEYLLERRGWEGIRELVARIRDGARDADAVAAVAGQPFDAFQRGWKAWLKGLKLRVHPGLEPRALRFANAPRKGMKDRDAGDADDAQEVGEEKARRFVRLGGMLRVRGRLAAAAAEYEKAQALAGPGHFVIAAKLARTWLGLGDAERAIAAATPAWDLYPDVPAVGAVLGEAWWRKKDGPRAAPYLEASLRVNPFDPLPHCALAEIYGGGDPRAGREQAACRRLSVGE